MSKEITVQNSKDVMREVEEAFFDIPFENSKFQTKHFVLDAQITPARAYRALGLRLHDRLNALNSAKYAKLREEIDIEEIREKISDPFINKFEKRRLEVDLMQKLDAAPFSDKLIRDAIEECNFLYAELQKFPKYTKEEFEAEEERHFLERSKRQVLGITSGKESLMNITHDKQAFEDFFENLQKEGVEKALSSMNNLLKIENN